MATAVFTTEVVELQDGSEVTLRPLPIAGLRVFMKIMDEFGAAQTDDEGFETLLNAGAFCLAKQRPDFWDVATKKATEAYEEVIDMPTVYKILDVMGGVKLNDPNLLAAAAGVLGQTSTS